MEKCPTCKGRLSERRIIYPQEYDGKVIILEDVPADVCQQCGEVWLRPEVVDVIQSYVWGAAEPHRKEEVPVFSLADVA